MTRDEPAPPHSSGHFLVHVDDGDARAPEAGFCEVVFPPFRVDASDDERRLVLRRGVTGALDLYSWFDRARRDKGASRRTVTVELMTPDLSRPVVTWVFHGTRPLSLSYTPLNALEAAVLIESLELEFETFEMR